MLQQEMIIGEFEELEKHKASRRRQRNESLTSRKS